ncbi:menaquinone biosynthetic enzyme MqnA/MqnD family protein [Kitasatospora viridis]|uniref:Chorismate dehydratase n=1 Tax=Kitasatospora viridis TaxID=281105 RepID=A0A561UCK3_9ACTN|nr:menaquinone biosynthesis protein [Kitasatospora viridis]TWF97075.1 futalosine synthase [Kitasatospora viridis]
MSTDLPRKPRVGHIRFLNCLPLLWGLSRTAGLLDLDLSCDTPERLGNALVAGELDLGPISLVEYLRHADELVVLPDLAVGSDGPVLSCLIVSKVPLDRLEGEVVSLCTTSRTSTRLARLILAERVGVNPVYRDRAPELATMLDQASAAVIIGDPALRATVEASRTTGLAVHDLGQLWREWTGLPFVFALFAVRRDYLRRHPERVRQVHAALLAARDLGLAEVDRVCEHAAQWGPFDEPILKRYFTEALDYGFGDRQLRGVAEFARRVAKADGGFPTGIRLETLHTTEQF